MAADGSRMLTADSGSVELLRQARGLVGDLVGAGVRDGNLFTLCRAVFALGPCAAEQIGGSTSVHGVGVGVRTKNLEFFVTGSGSGGRGLSETGDGDGSVGCLGSYDGKLSHGRRVDGNESTDAVGESVVGGGVAKSDGCDKSFVESSEVHGRHWRKNQLKRAKAKLAYQSRAAQSANWREKETCVKTSGSVCTVDTKTAVELQAIETLAARRVAENKLAAKHAEHRLRVLQDKDRTVAVDRLAAARYEQRINEAKAKSQASYKKCDESLKSLGSSGSAGEFALKQEVKRAKDDRKIREYVEKQAELLLKYATPEVRQMVAEMPPPVLEDEFDVFGDCPSEYDEDEREAYYMDLNMRNLELGLAGH